MLPLVDGVRLLHGFAHMVEDFGLGFVDGVGGDEGAGGFLVSPAVEVAGDLAAVEVAAAAEAEFESARLLLDEDDGELGTVDGEGHIDEVFAIAGEGAAGFEVVEADPGMDELAVQFSFGLGEDASGEVDSGEGFALVEIFVDLVGPGSGGDDLGGQFVGCFIG